MKFSRSILMLLFGAIALFPAQFSAARQAQAVHKLVLEVEGKGRVVIILHNEDAPKTCAHIMGLASKGFYDGQKFFRVVKSPRPFLVQFGDPNTKTKSLEDASIGHGTTGAKIPYEDSGYKHSLGAVGLSHLTEDTETGDCQFYVMLGSYGFLDGKYTVFGQVSEGLDIVQKIERGDRVTKVSVQ